MTHLTQRLCLRQPDEQVSFVSFGRDSHRTASPGAPDLMLEQDQLLPPPSAMQQCSGCQRASADARSLQQTLSELARRPRMPAKQAIAMLAVREYGAGATIHALVLAVLDALGRNATLFSPKLLLWAQPEVCARADLSCFFDSLPSLDSVMAASYTTKGLTHDSGRPIIEGLSPRQWHRLMVAWFGESSAHQILRPRRNGGAATAEALPSFDQLNVWMRPKLFSSKHRGASVCRHVRSGCPRLLAGHFAESTDENDVLQRLPAHWLRHGRFWLISQTLDWLTRPSVALRMRLDEARARLRFDEHQPVLALHVRKGDACAHRGECRGLAAVMPQLKGMAALYGFRTVYLATPSEDVVRETARYPQFKWLHLHENVTQTPPPQRTKVVPLRIEDALLQRRVEAVDEWHNFMVEVYLMAESAALIGAFSSNAVRLASALMAARAGGCLKPFISTDINWCHAFFRGGEDVLRRGPVPVPLNEFPSVRGITC